MKCSCNESKMKVIIYAAVDELVKASVFNHFVPAVRKVVDSTFTTDRAVSWRFNSWNIMSSPYCAT